MKTMWVLSNYDVYDIQSKCICSYITLLSRIILSKITLYMTVVCDFEWSVYS